MLAFSDKKIDDPIGRKMLYIHPTLLLLFLTGIIWGLYQEGIYWLLALLPVFFFFEVARSKSRVAKRDRDTIHIKFSHLLVFILIIILLVFFLIFFDIGRKIVGFLLIWYMIASLKLHIEDSIVTWLKWQAEHKIERIKHMDFNFLGENQLIEIDNGIKVKKIENELVIILDSRVYTAQGILSAFVNNIDAEDDVKDHINEINENELNIRFV